MESETLFRMKWHPGARAVYDALLASNAAAPVAPDAMYGLAWADLELKRPEAAAGSFHQFLAAWPDSPPAPPAPLYLARPPPGVKNPPRRCDPPPRALRAPLPESRPGAGRPVPAGVEPAGCREILGGAPGPAGLRRRSSPPRAHRGRPPGPRRCPPPRGQDLRAGSGVPVADRPA